MAPPLERVARALCRADGHPENIAFEGGRMWQSYCDEAQAALDALNLSPMLDILLAVAANVHVPPDLREKAAKTAAAFENRKLRA